MSLELMLASIIIFILSVAIPILFLSTKKLGPSNTKNSIKHLPYESGITNPYGGSDGRFSVKFYLVAIIFVIFDVEIMFMFPWAVNLRELGMFGIAEMFSFMFLLLAGLIYVYWKKALSWQ